MPGLPLPLGVASSGFDPSTISGLQGWWRADSLALADGAAVSSWGDSSSHGNAFAQATGTSQPIYKTGILNGKPVLRFDGVDDNLSISSVLGITTDFTVFIVFGSASTSNRGSILKIGEVGNLGATPNGYGFGVGNGNQDTLGGGHVGVAEGVAWLDTANTYFTGGNLVAWQRAATDSTVRAFRSTSGAVDSAIGTFTPAPRTPTTISLIGAGSNAGSNGTGRFAAVDVAEILVYNTALTSTDRQNVENYLGGKYGLGFGTGAPLTRSASESATLSEAVSVRVLSTPRARTESLALAESPTVATAHPRSASEAAATLGESPARIVSAVRPVAESLTLAESPVRLVSAVRSAVASLALGESPSRTLSTPRAASESASLASAGATTTQAVRGPVEGLTLVESVSHAVSLIRAATESLALAVAVSRFVSLPRGPVESAALSESAATSGHGSFSPSESLVLASVAVTSVNVSRALTEAAASLVESISAPQGRPRSPIEALLLAESATTSTNSPSHPRAASEALSLSDVPSTHVGRTRSAVEAAVTISEVLARQVGHVVTAAEFAVLVEVAARSVVLQTVDPRTVDGPRGRLFRVTVRVSRPDAGRLARR